ncbi:hypothetical protein [Nocardioides pyridinolyticus]
MAEQEQLSAHLRDISVARERLDEARRVGARSTEVNPLRADLLAALEGYAAAITRLGAPVPHRIHSEIELYRRLHGRS